ncbi:MAG: Lrp/AsnC family transcriptional regulator [Alphaproteobacteria bacterium]|nr:Lrp/AsnC family transcriptional regulator [Alphaproteobacteria bacterium]
MDALDRRIINNLQGGFPIAERPFAAAAGALSIDEDELLGRLDKLVADGTLSRFGPLYNAEAMGGGLTLAAMAVPAGRFEEVAEIVNGFPEVAHNYERDHPLNMWFVVATEHTARVQDVLAEIAAATGIEVLDMPKLEEFFLELRLVL